MGKYTYVVGCHRGGTKVERSLVGKSTVRCRTESKGGTTIGTRGLTEGEGLIHFCCW